MANWSELKASVAEVIKTNGNQEITGQILQNTLNSIISNLGENATFAGIAIPTTNPGTPDGNVFYIASENGEYVNFGNLTVSKTPSIISNKGGNWVVTSMWNNREDIYITTNADVYIERRIGSNKYFHFVITLQPGTYYIWFWKNQSHVTTTLDSPEVLDVSRGRGAYYNYVEDNFFVADQADAPANSVPLFWNSVGATGGPLYQIYLNQKYSVSEDSELYGIVKELYIVNPEDLPETAKYIDIRVNQDGYYDVRLTDGTMADASLFSKTPTVTNPKTIDVGSPYKHQSEVFFVACIDWDEAREYAQAQGTSRIAIPFAKWQTRGGNNPVSALYWTTENITVVKVNSVAQLVEQISRIATSVTSNIANKSNRYRIELASGVYELYDIINKSNITGSVYQRGIELPSYVDLRGIGSVTLKLTVPDEAPASYSEYLSTLNIYGENTIENINFEVTNGRYCLHDDNVEARNTNLIVRNCSFVHHANTIVPDQYACHCYGAGYSVGRKAIFENCIFKQEIPDGNVFLIHDHQTQGVNVMSYEAEIKNCYFEKGASETSADVACAICLSNAYGGIAANPANISISGCVVKGGIYTYSRQGYTGGYNIFGGGNEISGIINDLNANIYLANVSEI